MGGGGGVMIWESRPWKKEICRIASRLKKRMTQRRWVEASLYKLEHDVMISAYSARKLLEAKKLTDIWEDADFPVVSYVPSGTISSHFNWHQLERFFDLSGGKPELIRYRNLLNKIIHSYIFIPCFDINNGLYGFYCSSDKNRTNSLLFIKVEDYICFLHGVSKDDIISAQFVWNDNKKDYDIKSSKL